MFQYCFMYSNLFIIVKQRALKFNIQSYRLLMFTTSRSNSSTSATSSSSSSLSCAFQSTQCALIKLIRSSISFPGISYHRVSPIATTRLPGGLKRCSFMIFFSKSASQFRILRILGCKICAQMFHLKITYFCKFFKSRLTIVYIDSISYVVKITRRYLEYA